MRSGRRGGRVFSGTEGFHQLAESVAQGNDRHAAVCGAQVVIELLGLLLAHQQADGAAQRQDVGVLHRGQRVQKLHIVQRFFAEFDSKAVLGFSSDHALASLASLAACVSAPAATMYS